MNGAILFIPNEKNIRKGWQKSISGVYVRKGNFAVDNGTLMHRGPGNKLYSIVQLYNVWQQVRVQTKQSARSFRNIAL